MGVFFRLVSPDGKVIAYAPEVSARRHFRFADQRYLFVHELSHTDMQKNQTNQIEKQRNKQIKPYS